MPLAGKGGRVLLDTNILIALLAGEPPVVAAARVAVGVFIPAIALGELYYGALKSGRPAENTERITALATAAGGARMRCRDRGGVWPPEGHAAGSGCADSRERPLDCSAGRPAPPDLGYPGRAFQKSSGAHPGVVVVKAGSIGTGQRAGRGAEPARAASRTERTRVEGSSGNVFADLGLPDAEERLVKATLAIEIGRIIKARKLTQQAAAQLMGIDQPRSRRSLRAGWLATRLSG